MSDKALTEAGGNAVVVASEADQLLRLAVDKDLDVDKLAKLIEMRNAEVDRQARAEFIRAKQAFKRECPPLLKLREVSYDKTKYKYMRLDEMAKIIDPILERHGIDYHWEPAESPKGEPGVVCILSHAGGHEERGKPLFAPPDTSGKKGPLHAQGSTEQYLKRRSLVAALGVVTADPDTDAGNDRSMQDAEDRISERQAADLEAMIEDAGANREQFLKYFKIAEMEQLAASRYDVAIEMLEKRRRHNAGR